MKVFERAFYRCIEEDVSVGSALGGSPDGGGIGPYDIAYAGGRHGDNRLPSGPRKLSKSMGKMPDPSKSLKKKKKKKKKSKKKILNAKSVMPGFNMSGINSLFPLQRRPIIGHM